MPAHIIDGVITFLATELEDMAVWDGEVPRYSTDQTPIAPSSTNNLVWPVVKVYMREGGFRRNPTTEDPYDDEGDLLVQVWGITRQQEEAVLDSIEAIFAQASNWPLISLGGPADNPYYVISMLLTSWYSGQEEEARTGMSQLLYRGELHYETRIHGAIVSL